VHAPQRCHGLLPRGRRAGRRGARRARLRRAAHGPPVQRLHRVRRKTFATRRLAFQANGTNGADGWDILGIVVELDVDTVNRDLDLRELWNQEDPFELAPNYLGAYRARLNANLAVMDGVDGRTDWPLQPDGTHPLTELYLADYQVVDVAKRYAEDSYLEIEQSLLQGRAHATSVAGRSTTTRATPTSRSSSRAGMAHPSATVSTRRRCERRTASPTWLRPIPTRPWPAGPWPPPRSPTNSPSSKQQVWRAAEHPESPGEQSPGLDGRRSS
jgi:hypothetical protein